MPRLRLKALRTKRKGVACSAIEKLLMALDRTSSLLSFGTIVGTTSMRFNVDPKVCS